MTEPEGTVNPKPIISLMLAVSVGFWASELATYFTSLTQREQIDLTNFKTESIPPAAIDVGILAEDLRGELGEYLLLEGGKFLLLG